MGHIRTDLVPFVLVTAILIACLVMFWNLLDIVVLAISIAVVIYPLQIYCRKYLNHYLSAALVTILVFGALFVSVFFCLSIISQNIGILEEVVGSIEHWILNPSTDPGIFGVPIERAQVSTWLQWSKSLFFHYWNVIFSDTAAVAVDSIIFFVSLYVLLVFGESLRERIIIKIPETVRGHAQKISDDIVDTLYAIYVVLIAIAALTFVISIPFFWFLGYGHILFFSFLCAFFELIPVLGSSVVFIFLGAYALSIGDINSVIIIFFFGYVCISALPEIFVRPVLMGRRVRLHPLLMLIGFLGGIIALGMVGFVIGPVLIVLLMNIYRILHDKNKGLENPAPS